MFSSAERQRKDYELEAIARMTVDAAWEHEENKKLFTVTVMVLVAMLLRMAAERELETVREKLERMEEQ